MIFLDDVIDIFNAAMEPIDKNKLSVHGLNNTISEYILWLDRNLANAKDSFASDDIDDTSDIMAYLVCCAISGNICLEQYTYLIEDSCPWEWDYSLDEPVSITDTIILLEGKMTSIKAIFNPHNEDKALACLYLIKEMVILVISCMLQNIDDIDEFINQHL